jgi:hypothetical protein
MTTTNEPAAWTDDDLARSQAEARAAVDRMRQAFDAELAIARAYAFDLPDTIARDRMLENLGRYGTEDAARELGLRYQEHYINAAEYVRDLTALIEGMREARGMRHVREDDSGYPTLEELEAERLRLAKAGEAHGLGALTGPGRAFAGSRTTVRSRYQRAGLPPPGVVIRGVCDRKGAPKHAHHET